jgi:rubrerythrin
MSDQRLLTSRRDLLVTGGAALTAAAAAPLLRAGDALAQDSRDVAILRKAIALELVAVAAYQRATADLGGIARLFRNQERAHARTLALELRRLGGGPPPRVDVGTRLGPLSRAQGKRAVAQALIKLEDVAVQTYVDAHAKLHDARLMQVVSSILGNQAQHLVTLRDVAGQQKVPTAFETGRD